jgi:CubicO group peptidase (beta-lactamase class C family)
MPRQCITPGAVAHIGCSPDICGGFALPKQFTAMAILLLQERGKLTVQDLVCTYISGCPDTWKQITIHELLNQSSGIFDQGAEPVAVAAATPESYINLFKGDSLNAPPGTAFQFSDPGFIILSIIVAKVSGEPYETFVQKNIF